jgi:V/A-type H+-transporting ATPase subunit I
MIVPMKKVTILCLESAQDATLEHLHQLGLMHVEPVQLGNRESVEKARKDLEYVRHAMDILPHHPQTRTSGRTAIQIVRSLWKLIHERRDLEDEQQDLRHEEARIAPLGEFNPEDIPPLARKGLTVRIFQIDAKRNLPAPPGAVVRELARDKSVRIFAVIAEGSPAVDGLEIRMPAKSLTGIRSRLAVLERLLEENRAAAATFGGDYPTVAELAGEAEEHVAFLEARTGMGAVGQIVYLRGYCPLRDVSCIREAAQEGGWGLLVETPAETDPVPTLLDNPSWVRPIRTVFEMVGILPGYHEADISAVFLIFLSLFFAMLVGDAGYGALFLGLSLWMRRPKSGVPPHAVHFLMIMSVCTILWGLLTGTVFGIPRLPAVFQAFRVNWLDNTDHVMGLCFSIGTVHLTLAHLWNFWRNRRTLQAIAQIGWIAITWTMYFAANAMVLNQPFPPFGAGLLAAGVVGVVLFMTPRARLKEEWFNHAMLPLSLVSNFVDIVSYIRLFAVGTASLAVAQAFNQMALGSGMNSLLQGLFAALILFLGHALNIVLSVMGVIVHGVRLNTLEFSGHLGMQWTGVAYQPFSRMRRPVREEDPNLISVKH